MSQVPQPSVGSPMPVCPGCEEPLESDDRFCGACGYDLAAVPAAAVPDDHPTPAVNGAARAAATPPGPPVPSVPSVPSAPSASVEWPDVPEQDSSQSPAPVHLPTDLKGLDSTSSGPPEAASAPEAPALPDAPAVPAVPAVPDEFPLQPPAPPRAPDPRTVPPQPATPAGGKRCVACRAGTVDHDGYCEHCGHAQPRERDHMEHELGSVAAVSDRGLRHHRNEDAFAVSSTALPDASPATVAIVCDGVSSSTRPDEASLAASRAANEALLVSLPRGTHPQQALHEAIIAAAEAVNALAAEPTQAQEHDPHRQNSPACTLVSAVVAGGLLVVGWVGDSRVYWVPDDRSAAPARLTEDDSWAAQMVAAGLMSEAEAYADERAHAITGWLGADAYELEPHTACFKPDRAGVVVVCTDGLWNYAEGADELAAVIPADAGQRPLHSAQVLVGHALDGGGHDNVTVAVLPFPVGPQGAGSA
ncbi:protein phosphatase 2C domain-containing protein [Streptomyces apocyni]|uniref:protein phosphatase 2C domain-containing protein n=1 Tax=Streptomyces apocyni TaxID=2654677 RepID=UPI0012E9D859|nr:protein phosphatase 2C domain-containing protein [Streptomyces apocyni]